MDHITALQKELLILRPDSEKLESADQSERTDRQLVESALAGDESAFEGIFEKHKRRIALIASRFFADPSEIEEMIQISFIRAFNELHNFRGAHDFSLASWLNRIATNACLNRLKTRTTKIETMITAFSDHDLEAFGRNLKEKSAEELIVQRDLLEKILASLGADDRVLLQMLYAQEMSVAEVAKIFGWSRANVKIRAFRARRSLGRVLRKFV